TRIKNKSKRTDFVIKTIKPRATYRRILSGLVAPRSPLDLFFQYDFLDSKILGWNSWYAFRAHVAYMKIEWFGGRSVQIIDKNEGNNGFKPEAIKELKKLTDPHSYRVEFRPKVPTTYSKWEVEMTPEQEKAYREMKEHATTMLANEKHVTATVVIAQIMKLHQILCGHVKDEENVEHFLPENKTPDLLEILEDYSGKAIIWFSYDTDLRKVEKVLKEEYGDGCLARFWGGNTKTRDAEEKLFKNDPKCRFMLATPDSGGMGRTWDMADLAIYYSSKDNLEHRDQSEQRTMGRDKTRGVDVIDMVCPGTVEIKILEALRNKINMASVINGDTWREWVM
ncbi:MAG TPA: helicase-related protein, partial [Nitrososphaera sp.]|nr:helicase-related protein [Nitrososphaera sp.]